MALLFIDGYDHLAATVADLGMKYSSATSSVSVLSVVSGRVSGNGLKFQCGGGGALTLRKDLPSTYTVGTIGLAFQINANGSATWQMAGFYDSTSLQLSIGVNTSEFLTITRGSTTLWTDTLALTPNQWYFVEFKATINNTTGTIDVWLNGSSRTSQSGLNTRNTANNQFTGIATGCLTSITTTIGTIDDLYVCDTSTGLGSSSPVGNLRVVTSMPSGNSGDTSGHDQWSQTGGTGGNFWTSVNEVPEDGDTSYVSSSTVNQIENFTYASLPSTVSSIKGIQFNYVARTDDAGTRQIAPSQRNSGTDSVGSSSSNLPSGYTDTIFITETSLQTASAWTTSEFNSSEFGVKLTV